MTRTRLASWILIGGPIAVFSLWAMFDNTRLYFVTLLNGLTLASLYFIVASGFTLVFGLMRNVNLAHGSLYLLGGYVGYVVAGYTGWWILALAAGFAVGGARRLADAMGHPAPHAGAGPAPDDGDHRHVDRRRRHPAVDLHRPGAPDGSAVAAARPHPRPPADQRLRRIQAQPAGFRHRHRPVPVVAAGAHARGHDDPRRRRRPRHARRRRRQREPGVRRHLRARRRAGRLRRRHRCGRAVAWCRARTSGCCWPR